jgi:putative adenylate-forming enzyme
MLWTRHRLERSCRWTRAELERRQADALSALRRFALDRSPFYRRFHRGLESRSLAELPVLTKPVLMEHFDDVVTDRAVRLADATAFLASQSGPGLFRGRYVVLSTSGSTGLRGVFLFDPSEWRTALAQITRPMLWAGVAPNPIHPPRIAFITSTNQSHYSCRVGQALESPFVPTMRMDAAEPLPRIVDRLNAFRPDVVGIYPSVLRQLAVAQLEGRLRIRPRKINTSAEVLTDDDRRRAREAWGIPVHDTYGATEYAPIAAECQFGNKHLFEDGAIIEIDRDRVLLTVLHRRTQPLIRYEVSDMVKSVEVDCPCGRPFRTVAAVEGRSQDILTFGGIPVHPKLFHQVLEDVPASGWQVIQEGATLHVLLTGLRDPASCDSIGRSIREMLSAAGAPVPEIRVSTVNELRRGATGKAPLVMRAVCAAR